MDKDLLSSKQQAALQERVRTLFSTSEPKLRLLFAFTGLSFTALATQYLAAKVASRKPTKPVKVEGVLDDDTISIDDSTTSQKTRIVLRTLFPLGVTAAQLLLFKVIKTRYGSTVLKWAERVQLLTSTVSLANYLPLDYARNVQASLGSSTYSIKVKVSDIPVLGSCYSTALASALAISQAYENKWWKTNLLAVGSSWSSIAFAAHSSFKWELARLAYFALNDLLLVGYSHKLFEENVMDRLASKLGGDVKLSWPIANARVAILGTGDIIIPGALIALAAKFDSSLAKEPSTGNSNGGEPNQLSTLAEGRYKDVWTPSYLSMALGGSAVGLASACFAGINGRKAVPALVHLAPATALPILALAWYRGELAQLWDFPGPNYDRGN